MTVLTDEQIHRLDKLEFHNLAKVDRRMKRRFWFGPCAIESILTMPSVEERGFDANKRPYLKGISFGTAIFFKNAQALEKCRRHGGIEKIKAAFREELERAGRGKRDEVVVNFYFDHKENVEKYSKGIYMKYMQEHILGMAWSKEYGDQSWLENDRTWFRKEEDE